MKKNLFLLVMMLMPLCTWAEKQGYAVFDSNTGTLTFKYGEKPSGDNVYDTDNTGYLPKWYDYGKGICAQVKKVVFEESFSEARPSSTNSWFNGAKELTEIVDIKNLNTDEVTNMASMFYYCESLETIDLANFNTDKVTDMNRMFSGCSSLTSLDLSSFNVENVTNMEYMFSMTSGKSNLETINLGSFNAYNVKTFYYMFSGNSNLTKIETTSFNTEKATNYHSMFNGCKSLESIDVSNFNTSPATDLSDMFEGCTNLKELNLSNFDTSNATNISYMFYKCASLTSIDLSSFNTANVTSMGGMFKGCESLKELNLNHFNTENVVGMGAMFQDCKSLESLDIKNFNTSKCTNFTDMFSRCESLTNLDVTNFNTENAKNMMSMFACCYGLTKLDVANFVTSNVTNMQSMFAYCRGLEKLDLTKFDTGNVTAMSSMFMDCRNLTTLDLSSFNTENVTATNYMFYNCENLITIYISDNWITKNITTSGSMFSLCQKLKGQDGTSYNSENVDATYAHANAGGYMTIKDALSTEAEPYAILSDNNTVLTFYYDNEKKARKGLNIGPFRTYTARPWNAYTETIKTVIFDESMSKCNSITSTALWFYFMKNMTTISGLSNLNTENITAMNHMFNACFNLKEVDLRKMNTEKVETMEYMFDGCKSLTNLDMRSFNTANVKAMSGMFRECRALESIDVSSFNTEKVVSMEDLFEDCVKLPSLDISNFSTQNATHMKRMFSGCKSLKYLNLGRLSTENVTDMTGLFAKCSNIDIIDISNFDTQRVKLMDYMFYECNNLTTIYIGDKWGTSSVTSSTQMFFNCTKLKGQDGTQFDSNNIEVANAHANVGGYMTMKGVSTTAEPYAALSEDNTVLTFYYDGQKEARDGMDVGPFEKAVDRGWHQNSSSITKVVFDDSFADCTDITSTSCWFNGFYSLSTISGISNLKTGNVTDMSCMFLECHKLTSLDVSGFKTDNVTDMSGMFGSCLKLTNIDVSGFNTANVTDMSGMFSACSSLTSLNLSNFNTSNVTKTASMFAACSSLTNLTLSNFNTENVTDMGQMFGYCEALTSLDLSGFSTAKVWGMSEMLYECKSLTTIYVDEEKWSTASVTSSDDLFTGCTALVGGNGTAYNEKKVNVEYARIDKEGQPGYLTQKSVSTTAEPYAALSEDDTVLTFYYDDQKDKRNGMDIGPFINDTKRGWHESRETITKVVFDSSFANLKGLTSTAFWFKECNNLTNIEGISNLKTDDVTNMTCMFEACSSLTDLDVSHFNTSNVTDMRYMFMKCSSLTTLDIRDFDTSNVTSMMNMFQGCEKLESLDVSKFNTSKVSNMDHLFWDCKNVSTLDVSNFNTDNLTTMEGLFHGCSVITKLNVSKFNTSDVKSMGGLFFGCSNLTSIEFGKFDTHNVQDMTAMFYACSNLTSLDLSNFDTKNVTQTGSMFEWCSNLKTIYIGDKWSTEKIDYSGGMFANCTSLVGQDGTTYDKNKIHDATYNDATYAHANAGGYMTMKNPAQALNEGDSFTVDGITYSVIDTENLKVQVGKGDYDDAYDTEFTGTLNIPSSVSGPDGKSYTVTAIAAHAFYRCKLSGVTLPNTLEEIGVGSFRECWSMTSINFPSSLTAIRTEAFAECKLLTTISIPASVRTISINAFQSCSGITSMVVDADNKVYDSRDNCNAIIETKSNTLVFGCQNTVIPNTVTTIAERSFFGCETLKAISFPNSVTSIKSHAFYKCTGLTSIIIPSSLTDLGDNPFAYCSGLESVSVEEGNTTFDTRNNCNAIIRTANSELVIGCKNSTIPETVNIIGPSAFYYCEDITSITLPDGLTEIANEAFVGCRLTSVTFPTSLKRIGVWAFQGCPFESLEIPDNVTEIGKLAFSFCNSLTTITLPNSLTNIGESAFGYSSNITTINSQIANPYAINENVFSEQVYAKAALNVPTGSKEKYQSVDGWKNFANITEVVSDLQEGIEALNTKLTDLRSQLQSIWGKLYNKTFGEYDRAGDCHESLTTLTNMVWQLSAKTSEIKTKEELEEAEAKFISYANEAETIGQQVDNFSIEFGDTFTFTNAQGIDLKFTILDASAKTCLVGDMSRLDGINSAVDISLAGVLDIPEKVEYDGVSYTVTEVGPGAFAQCQFSNISMPSTISHIWRSAFWYSQLTDITIPEAVTGMGPQVFSSCLQLKTVTCLIKNPFAIDKAMFSGKYNNEIYDYDFTTATLYVPAGTKAIYETTEGWKEFTEIKEIGASSDAEPYAVLSEDNTVLTFYYDDKKEARGGMDVGPFTYYEDSVNSGWYAQREDITNVIFDASFANCTSITSTAYWFHGCGRLEKIIGIENLNTGNVTDMADMFWGCMSLKSLDLSNFNTSKVTKMSQMFYGCMGLKSLQISNFNTENVKSMVSLFEWCSALEDVDISNFNTSNVTLMRNMFMGCKSVRSLDLSNFNTANVISMSYMFNGCGSLTSIYIDENKWNTNRIEFSGGLYLFDNCSALVGGNGTAYDSKHTDVEYARIDKEGQPGYFTQKEGELKPMKEKEEVTFGEDGKITEETSLSGTIINNVYYNISSENGHFDATDGCVVVTKTMSDEDVEAVLGKDLMSDDVKQTFAGIVIEVPAGKGKVTVNAETTGGMTLKVKIGNQKAVKLKFDGKTKMKVPYNVSEPTYVYIYAAESAAQARERIAKGGDEPSVKIYGIGIEPSDILLGDADNDDVVDVNDVVSIVNHILNKTAVSFNEEAADVNGDGSIDVADVVATVNIILGKSSGARSKASASSAETENDHLSLTGNERDGYSLSLNNAGRYQAAQFDICLVDGQTLETVSLNMMRCGNHQMAYAKIDEDLYRVLIYNIGGEAFDGNNGELLRMSVAGSGELAVSDIKFITDTQSIKHFAPLSAGTTGINAIILLESPADIYSLDGRLIRKQATNTEGLKKGLYIVNGQKMYIR